MKQLFLFSMMTAMVLVSVSCNTQVKEERLKRIDSLGIHLNYVQEAANEIDSMTLINRVQDIDRTSSWIYDNITDTLDRVPGLILGDYMRTKKYLGQSLERYNQVNNELRYSRKQLDNLRKDVKGSFYSEEEFNGYFNTESSSIANLVSATDELKDKFEMSDSRYRELKPKMTAVVDSIKSIIYADEPIAP